MFPLLFCCFALVVLPLFFLLCSLSSFLLSSLIFFLNLALFSLLTSLFSSFQWPSSSFFFFALSLSCPLRMPSISVLPLISFSVHSDFFLFFVVFFVPRFFLCDIPLHLPPTTMNAESETGPLLRQLAVIAARKRILALQQWRMVFYLPNAVHWAFYKPPFHPGVVAVLGLAEAIVGAIQAFPQPKSASP